jgi:DNA-binding transcriptional MocR family regulator
VPGDAPISLARGAPSLDIIDADGLSEAAQRAFANDPAGTFAYGTSKGYGPLVEWIAEQHGVEQNRVIATNGSMQADAFLFRHLVEPGDQVVVEAPSYDRTLLALREMGAELVPIPLEADGIDVTELERRLRDGVRPKLAHVIPNFHNPAGATLAEAKRRRLLELAAEFDFLVFEDDPYVALRFEGEAQPRMLDLDESGNVVYASSFSKTVCPGIRVGYLVGPEPLVSALRTMATNTYISPSMVSQSIVAEFARSGRIHDSIETVKRALHARRDAVGTALERELPDARFISPEGGYFLWVELPDGADSDALADAAKERGVVIVRGADFLLEGGERYFRIAYSGVTPDQIDEGIGRLGAAYNALAGATA